MTKKEIKKLLYDITKQNEKKVFLELMSYLYDRGYANKIIEFLKNYRGE